MQEAGTRDGLRADDVISKMKDDGDFDRLRVNITRKVKENEELRNKIISLVKESAALNSPDAESMKPRQLSDAIHQELGDKLMTEISESVWKVIRSADGMQKEISETVQSVYDRITQPHGLSMNLEAIQNGVESHRDSTAAASGTNGQLPLVNVQDDMEPDNLCSDAPPGFSHVQVSGDFDGEDSEAPPGFS